MDTLRTEHGTAKAFAERIVGVLNDATLALMISVGHRTGLFDAMGELPASTSEQIAGAAGLHERYVREWLGAMATGRIVTYDPDTERYTLPAEGASCLTRGAGVDNLAMLMQYVALLGNVEDQVVDCFTEGGGVPYSAYPNFQRLMAEESAQIHDARLVDAIVPLVPGLVDNLKTGVDVLDVGCGQGHAINLLATKFPRSRFTGVDISEAGIKHARAEAASLGVGNARFEGRDAAALDELDTYDLVTAFDAIHDQADPAKVLAGIHQSLRPNGAFLCVDIAASSSVGNNLDHPLGPSLYTFSTMHCMTVSLAQGGAGLGAVWGEEKARQMLSDAGFADIAVYRLDGDLINNYYVATKPSAAGDLRDNVQPDDRAGDGDRPLPMRALPKGYAQHRAVHSSQAHATLTWRTRSGASAGSRRGHEAGVPPWGPATGGRPDVVGLEPGTSQ
jgi:2-polyprenyl-3-methyl-5-hydroxy-6-metoxy-1,4-benzoquinol methylase